MKDASVPVLKLTIKNVASYLITLYVGDNYTTSGNDGASGHRAYGMHDIPANSPYTVYTIPLNKSFTSSEIIQLRPTVIDGGKATTNGAAGLYIDKIEVSGIPSELPKYSLTTSVQGSGTIELSPSGGSYESGTKVTLTPKPAAGYKFSNWSGDLAGNDNPAEITMDKNKSVTAVFVEEGTTYTLTTNVSPSGSGSIKLNPPGGSYDAGTEVTLTATDDAGWRFKEWSGDLTGNTNPITLTMVANKSVTAVFEEFHPLPPVGDGDKELKPVSVESTPITINGFYLGSGMSLESNTKQYDGVDYTVRMKTNGTGPQSDRIIKFAATTGEKVTVLAMSAGSSGTRILRIAPVVDGTVDTTSAYDMGETPITDLGYFSYTIPADGEYAIYFSNSGINIYYVSVTGP